MRDGFVAVLVGLRSASPRGIRAPRQNVLDWMHLRRLCDAAARYLAQQEGEEGFQEGEYIQEGEPQDYVHTDADGYHLVQPQDYQPQEYHTGDADQVNAAQISHTAVNIAVTTFICKQMLHQWSASQATVKKFIGVLPFKLRYLKRRAVYGFYNSKPSHLQPFKS